MNKALFLIMFAILCQTSFAQSLQETTIDFNNTPTKVFAITLNDKSPKIIQLALKEMLENREGLKGVRQGSYIAYKDQSIFSVGEVHLNLYTRIIETNETINTATVIFVALSDNGTPINPQTHPSLYQSMVNFLSGFPAYFTEFETAHNITLQQKHLEKLSKEQQSLNAQRERAQKQLDEINSKIATKEAEIQTAQNQMALLKGETPPYTSDITIAE